MLAELGNLTWLLGESLKILIPCDFPPFSIQILELTLSISPDCVMSSGSAMYDMATVEAVRAMLIGNEPSQLWR